MLDGALGTELARDAAVDLRSTAVEALVFTRPDLVHALHARYVAAGAGALHTLTFSATAPRLERVGLGAQTATLNRAAVRLAREAASASARVLGDIGPLVDLGLSPEVRCRAYRAQAHALASAGVDAFHIETQCCPRDLAAAIGACREVASSVPVFTSLTVAPTATGYASPIGTRLAALVGVALSAEAAGIGLNCTLRAHEMVAAVRALRAMLPQNMPLPVQPCASLPPAPADSPEVFAGGLREVFRAGATSVGGCCGTTPAHISAARAVVSARG